jgi:hypothetical protein
LAANVGAAIGNHVDFQIEIVPADGLRASIFRKQRLRNVADLGQLSVEMISVDRVSN